MSNFTVPPGQDGPAGPIRTPPQPPPPSTFKVTRFNPLFQEGIDSNALKIETVTLEANMVEVGGPILIFKRFFLNSDGTGGNFVVKSFYGWIDYEETPPPPPSGIVVPFRRDIH